jgi:cutinase
MGSWLNGNRKHGNYTPHPAASILLTKQGTVVGPPTSDGLKRIFGVGAVATEGIDYEADLLPNALPGGTDNASKRLMQRTLNAMASQCPESVIVTGGYSQGAAVNHRAIEELDAAVQDQIAGVILYGDTQKQQVRKRQESFAQLPSDSYCRTITKFPTSPPTRLKSYVRGVT